MLNRKLLEVYKTFAVFHLPRKLLFLSIALFAIFASGFKPELGAKTLLGFLVFFFTYVSIYFINDFFDYEFDKRRKHLSYNKPLVTLGIEPKIFCFLGYLHGVLGLALAFLISKEFAVLLGITLMVAHVRSLFKGPFSRVFLLIILEFLNLLTLAVLMLGPLATKLSGILKLGGIFLPVSFLYGFGYRAYRKPEKKVIYTSLALFSFVALLVLFNSIVKYHSQYILALIFLGLTYGALVVALLAKEGRDFKKKEITHGIVSFIGALLLYYLAIYLKG